VSNRVDFEKLLLPCVVFSIVIGHFLDDPHLFVQNTFGLPSTVGTNNVTMISIVASCDRLF
jgi:hypothetical protein